MQANATTATEGEGELKLVDCGNEGKRLADFTAKINMLLQEGGSHNVVNDDQVKTRGIERMHITSMHMQCSCIYSFRERCFHTNN
jgi:hypothetical protein